MRAGFRLVFITGVLAILSVTDARAQAGPRCRPGELVDARGQCAPAPKLQRPKATPKPPSQRVLLAAVSMLSARHLILEQPSPPGALAVRVQRARADLSKTARGTPAHEAAAERLTVRLFAHADALDREVMTRAKTCLLDAPGTASLKACLAVFRPLLAQRDAAWQAGLAFWSAERMRAPKAQGVGRLLFFEAAAHAALGRAEQATSAVNALLQSERDSSYTPFGMALLGDLAFASGAHMTALRMFHRAEQMGGPVEAYALYMKGWCYAERGDPVAGMQQLIKSHVALRKPMGARVQGRGLLISSLYQDMVTLYAVIGRADQAAAFWRELGLSGAQRRALLTMLASRYASAGDEASAKLAREQADAQTDATINPNAPPFKIHRLDDFKHTTTVQP